MKAKSPEDLQVFQKAIAAADAVSAILKRPCFRSDPRLKGQMGASSERVASLISEGFGQSTDRHFAEYLYRSRASSYEIRTQLRISRGRGYITRRECDEVSERYDELHG